MDPSGADLDVVPPETKITEKLSVFLMMIPDITLTGYMRLQYYRGYISPGFVLLVPGCVLLPI